MKKTLLVAAMMASFTGAAVAQNSVTLYGRLAPSFAYTSIKVDGKAAATLGIDGSKTFNQFQTADGFNAGGAGSNWGLKGVEDLGNGLKVSFKFEQAFKTTDGSASTSSGRVAAVTVSNAAWGSIGFGRDVAAADTIMAGVRAIGGLSLANANTSLETAAQRYSNQVKYLSPTISGLRLGLSYSFAGTKIAGAEEGKFGTVNKNRVLNAGLRYANGPVVAAGLYTRYDPNNNIANISAITNFLVGGSYDLKVVKIHAAYGQSRDGIIGRANLPGSIGGSFETLGSGAIFFAGAKTNQYAVGLTAPVGAAGKVALSVAQKMPGGTLDGDKAANQTNAGITYQYSLSKRTSISGGIAYTKNLGMVDGITTTQIGGGILHTL